MAVNEKSEGRLPIHQAAWLEELLPHRWQAIRGKTGV
jgi:hypothetical protein